MKQKPKNPYQRLLDEVLELTRTFKWRHKVELFCLTESALKSSSYNLLDIYHKVQAAQSLGYDVVLEAANDRLFAFYHKKAEIPYHLDGTNI